MNQDDISPAGFIILIDMESISDAPMNLAYYAFPAKYNSMVIGTRANAHTHAPEIYSDQPFSRHTIDLWSVGIILFIWEESMLT